MTLKRGCSSAKTTTQQTQSLKRKSYLSLVEEAKFRNRREQKSWLWFSRRVTPGMAVLAKTSSSLTDRPRVVRHNMVMSLVGPGTKKSFAGEGQH